MRALILASLANGTSIINNPLRSNDSKSMIEACRQFGAVINEHSNGWQVTGIGGKPQQPSKPINCGNSGQVLRFGAAIAALCKQPVNFDGDTSIRQRRCMQAVLSGINQLNGQAISLDNNDRAPISINGPCKAKEIIINGQYAQPVSSLIILATQLAGLSTIHVDNLLEPSWVQLTLDWLASLGIIIHHTLPSTFLIEGIQPIPAFNRTIASDFSQAAYALCCAIMQQRPLTINNLDWHDSQGDKQLFYLLAQSGIELTINEDKNSCIFNGNGQLNAGNYNISDFNDALPIFAVLATRALGPVTITGASNTKHKESNRLLAMQQELSKMGANVEMHTDGLRITPSSLHHTCLSSHDDHRIAMALAIAASCTQQGVSTIDKVDCVDKSYPSFCSDMNKLGLTIQALTVGT